MRNFKKQSKAFWILLLAACVFLPSVSIHAEGNVPYDTYNYDYREYIVYTPAAYIPEKSIAGSTLGAGNFSNPQDLCIGPDGLVYVADTNHNRIVVLDQTLTKTVAVIDSFQNAGAADQFKAPYGVAVSKTNQLYIADSENRRIVVLADGELVKIIENPVSEVLEDGFVFTPLKVCVDYADRVYCIAKGMFEGIMMFDENGIFTGFYGTINMSISAWDKFLRRISTKAERSKQRLFIPTEFTGIDIDDAGFVYASNYDSTGVQAVRRLNPNGQDVIEKGTNGNLGGDIQTTGFSSFSGVSRIVDVVVQGKGIYSMLDSKRGRIFTYDHEGNLLYIFGGLGTQAGTFTTPAAIEAAGGRIIVLDASRNEILLFHETNYGRLINEAVGLRYDGDETQAVAKWHEVLKLDENNELANTGIGKAYLSAGDNQNAMKYLKLGMNRHYYSIAFKRYRNNLLKDSLQYFLSGLLICIAVFGIVKKSRKKPFHEEEGSVFDA